MSPSVPAPAAMRVLAAVPAAAKPGLVGAPQHQAAGTALVMGAQPEDGYLVQNVPVSQASSCPHDHRPAAACGMLCVIKRR